MVYMSYVVMGMMRWFGDGMMWCLSDGVLWLQGLSIHMQHRLTFIWFNPDRPLHSIPSHTYENTKKITMKSHFILHWTISEK